MLRHFSVVCPVHNEEKYIPNMMRSIQRIVPNEVFIILDRCTDKSRELIEKHHVDAWSTLRIEEINEPVGWKMRAAYLRRFAYERTKYDTILNTSADVILDPSIRKHLEHLKGNVKLVKLGYLDYPFSVKGMLRRVYDTLTPFKDYAGIFFFSKKAWQDTENQESVKNITSSEDTHLQLAIAEKYKTKYVNTRTLHLRSREDKKDDVSRGINYHSLVRASPLKTFAISVAMLRPHMFTSFMSERSKNK